jgi:putative FmdB family regulatory protein
MPIYEYQCRDCSDEFEVLQKIGDRPLRRCKKCSGRVDKLISRTAFVLKGGGWYSEGYTRGGKKPAKASGGSESPGSKSKSTTKSDSSGGDKKSATA